MELSERKLKILQAIISDFIMNAEPVGSRTLSRRHDIGISPATIRNEMADLEDMGYLYHPHTSSGRVPSDKAYRLYVNSLMDKYELAQDEKKRIRKALNANISELEKTVRYASELLADITNLTSFATVEEDMQGINVFLEGMTKIFAHPEYNSIDRARTFLEMVDNKETLTNALANRREGLYITIGNENTANIVPDSSIITATYHVDGHLVGKLGVIGPTRMRYDEIASVIEFMSNNLERSFKMLSDPKKGEENEDE